MFRAMVFVDGNNFYFKLRDLTTLTIGGYVSLRGFDFMGFSQWLSQPSQLIEVRYYIGAMKRQRNNEKSEKMFSDQQRLFAHLQQQDIRITLGQLIQHPDKTFHEKGVDVRLAIEMVRFAREDRYDLAFLVSSDTDLVAAVEEVKSLGKSVHYVGIPKGQSFGLTKVCNDTLLLRPEDVRPFLSTRI